MDVVLTISLPNVNPHVAGELVRKTDVVRPYSHASRDNISVGRVLA